MSQHENALYWHNDAGSVRCAPNHRSFPVTLEEVQSEVLRCAEEGERLRVTGSGRALTPLCHSDENQMSLSRYTGIESCDMAARRVWVRTGTRLGRLGELLADRGLALECLGDSPRQTLGGALSTGTPGGGPRAGRLSASVLTLRMVCADGSVKEIGADQPELRDAAAVSLGALGVITHAEFQCVEARPLHAITRRAPLAETLNRLDHYRATHPHVEFLWFPYTRSAHLRLLDPDTRGSRSARPLQRARTAALENGAYWLLSEAARRLPLSSARISRLCSRGLPAAAHLRAPHQAPVSPSWVRYTETEYSVDAEDVPDIIHQIDALIRALNFQVHLPVKVRYAPADSAWLSPGHGQDSASIGVRMYRGMPYRDYFAAVTEIFDRYDGRPHWGKLHDKGAHELAELYPRFSDFCELRRRMDPRGVFLNDHLTTLFGVERR